MAEPSGHGTRVNECVGRTGTIHMSAAERSSDSLLLQESKPFEGRDERMEMTPREALAGRPKVTDPSIQNALYVADLNWVSWLLAASKLQPLTDPLLETVGERSRHPASCRECRNHPYFERCDILRTQGQR